ncbi:MAG: hypothetical protein K0S28_482 [Paucimonas sp.]|jgi:hypothetical protein|nr:hypothetical protein [Paucimonas sp.]
MTTDGIRQADDAEFDDFLRKEGELARAMKGVEQPQLSAGLRDKVLADIEAKLAKESMPQAANEAAAYPTALPPRRRFSNLVLPFAFAASVLAGVLGHSLWKTTVPADATVAAARLPLEVKAIPEERASMLQTMPDATPSVPAPPPAPAQMERTIREEPQAKPVPLAAPPVVIEQAAPVQDKVEEATVAVTGIRPSLQQSLNMKRTAPSEVEVVTAEDIGKMPDKQVAESLQRVPGISVPPSSAAERDSSNPVAETSVPPAPAFASKALARWALAAADNEGNSGSDHDAKRQAWLARIEKKMDAGLTLEAAEEWKKFRKTYPDHVIPEPLAAKLRTLKAE